MSVSEIKKEVTHILLKDSNRQALTDPDGESHPHTWDELKHILGTYEDVNSHQRKLLFLMASSKSKVIWHCSGVVPRKYDATRNGSLPRWMNMDPP